MITLLDPGHGIGTPGKRSPDGRLREYAYNRSLARSIQSRLTALGLDARIIVPEDEDISLQERCRRVNDICLAEGTANVILLSLHLNAAGKGDRWMDARGWSCFTTRGDTGADRLASCLYDAAKFHLPGMRLRTDYTDGDPDIEKDFYVLRHTLCPAALTENLFQDNLEDYAFLLSAPGHQALVDLHVVGITTYLSSL